MRLSQDNAHCLSHLKREGAAHAPQLPTLQVLEIGVTHRDTSYQYCSLLYYSVSSLCPFTTLLVYLFKMATTYYSPTSVPLQHIESMV